MNIIDLYSWWSCISWVIYKYLWNGIKIPFFMYFCAGMFGFCIYLTFRKDFAIKLSAVLTFQLCRLVRLQKWLKRQKRKKRKTLFLNFDPKLFSKVEWEADPSVFRLLLWGTNSQFGLRTQTNSVFKMKLENWCLANAEVWQMYLPLNWGFVFTGKRLILGVIFLML